MKQNIYVAAGLVINNERILIAQRKKGKKHEFLWEFPGGKTENDETIQECLKREFIEEFDMIIDVHNMFKSVTFDYDYAFMTMDIFWASTKCCEAKKLTAHEKIAWVLPKQLKEYEFTPPDQAIIDELIEHLQSSSQSLS